MSSLGLVDSSGKQVCDASIIPLPLSSCTSHVLYVTYMTVCKQHSGTAKKVNQSDSGSFLDFGMYLHTLLTFSLRFSISALSNTDAAC